MVPSAYFPHCPTPQPQWFSPASPRETPWGGALGFCEWYGPRPRDHLDRSASASGPVIGGQGASPGLRLASAEVNIRKGGAGPEVEAEGGG